MSAAARNLANDIDRAAASDAKVLVTGESGAGKEVAARLIHLRGVRRNGPLVSINCVGLPDSLLESELFGHVRGSFTGAYRDREGLLKTAHRGTALLDEVGEMSLRMQALLLRFLETGEIQPVGGHSANPIVNVRIIAATHRSLRRLVEEKSFREDLFYRLNVVEVRVPALRERLEDLPLLARHFVERFCEEYETPIPRIASEAFERLMEHRWPGNVRELRNVVERTVVRQTSGTITAFETPNARRRAVAAADIRVAPAPAPLSAEALFDRIARQGESFWQAAYEPFIRRDLTRTQVRGVVSLGLEATCGSYKVLADLFGVAPTDYKRFLGVLRKHQCHVPFQPYRRPMIKPQGLVRPVVLPESVAS
ncbi:MAG: sigma 54-interacting transcriptional regulator [Vicinamibacterales bacterium]